MAIWGTRFGKVYGLVGRQVTQRLARTVALPVAVIRPSVALNGSGIRE